MEKRPHVCGANPCVQVETADLADLAGFVGLVGIDHFGTNVFAMIFEKSAPPDNPLVPVVYAFLERVTVILRRKDGRLIRVGFGVGEKIRVMEPRLQFLVGNRSIKQEILLEDGTAIVGFPHDMRSELEYGQTIVRGGRPGNGWLEDVAQR